MFPASGCEAQNEVENEAQNEVGANRRTNRRVTRRANSPGCSSTTAPCLIPLSLRTAKCVTWTNWQTRISQETITFVMEQSQAASTIPAPSDRR
jgi:hypothetical protein